MLIKSLHLIVVLLISLRKFGFLLRKVFLFTRPLQDDISNAKVTPSYNSYEKIK